jgi:hypothetical protein
MYCQLLVRAYFIIFLYMYSYEVEYLLEKSMFHSAKMRTCDKFAL